MSRDGVSNVCVNMSNRLSSYHLASPRQVQSPTHQTKGWVEQTNTSGGLAHQHRALSHEYSPNAGEHLHKLWVEFQ